MKNIKKYKLLLVYCFYIYSFFTISKSYACERIFKSEGYNGAISCGHPLAAETAIKILKAGGNAVDASIAAAFVLGVVDFSNSGIGGEAYALIHFPNGKVIAIDGSTRRPINDIKKEYKSKISLPAIPEMLLKMRRLFGTQKNKILLEQAITLCEDGFEVSPYLSDVISKKINKINDQRALKLISDNNIPLKPKQILYQPILGKTLKQLALDDGLSFYFGKDADLTIQDMKNKGSAYNKYDFMNYRSKLCKPITIIHKDFTIFGNPIPSSSISTIKLALKLVNMNQPLLNQKPEDFLNQASICRTILEEKYSLLSSFYNNTEDYFNLNKLNKSISISENAFSKNNNIELKKEKKQISNTDLINTNENDDGNTTHLCVWDKNNMIVSMTLTLGTHFGTGQLAPGGFFYANSLNNYSKSVVKYHKDYPSKFGPITSKSPIIVKKSNNPYFALGGAGANRIITNTAYVLARLLKGYDLNNEIIEQRFYIDDKNKIIIEKNNYNQSLIEKIKSKYSNTFTKNYPSDYFGLISLIIKKDNVSTLTSFGDKHRDGSCLAY